MKLHIVSDLHADSRSTQFENPFSLDMFDIESDVIIIAGDTSNKPTRSFGMFEMLADRYKNKEIVCIFGNHEYYGGDFIDINYDIERYKKNNTRKNLHFLNDTFVLIDGVAFFGSVFWTAFNLYNPLENKTSREQADKNFSDYYSITDGIQPPPMGMKGDDAFYAMLMPRKAPLTTKTTIRAHNYALKQMAGFVKHFEGKKRVVITHHSPSPLSIHPKYEGDLINNCFHSNHLDLMGTGIDLWVHGHTHSSFDYMVEDTRVICNPRGYGVENSYGFVPDLVVEI